MHPDRPASTHIPSVAASRRDDSRSVSSRAPPRVTSLSTVTAGADSSAAGAGPFHNAESADHGMASSSGRAGSLNSDRFHSLAGTTSEAQCAAFVSASTEYSIASWRASVAPSRLATRPAAKSVVVNTTTSPGAAAMRALCRGTLASGSGQATSISGSASATNIASSTALIGPALSPISNPNPDTWPEHDRCYSQSKQVDTGAGERTTLRKQHSDDRTGRHDQRRLHDGPGDAEQGERDKHSGDGEHDEHAGGEADGTQPSTYQGEQREDRSQTGEQHREPVENGPVRLGFHGRNLCRVDQQRQSPHRVTGYACDHKHNNRSGCRQGNARKRQRISTPHHPHQHGCKGPGH